MLEFSATFQEYNHLINPGRYIKLNYSFNRHLLNASKLTQNCVRCWKSKVAAPWNSVWKGDKQLDLSKDSMTVHRRNRKGTPSMWVETGDIRGDFPKDVISERNSEAYGRVCHIKK